MASLSSEEAGLKPDDVASDLGLGILQRQFQKARSGTLLSFSSRTSLQSSVPIPLRKLIRRLTAGSTNEAVPPPQGEDDVARQEFLRFLFKGEQKRPALSQWYIRFLEFKFKQSWTSLLEPSLVGIRTTVFPPFPKEVAIVYRFLIIVAKVLIDKACPALSDIVDDLMRATPTLLKQQSDGSRGIPNQLAFAAVSWLTLLFEAAARPAPDELEIRRQTASLLHEPRRTRAITNYRQGFGAVDQPLCVCFKRFGSLVPGLKIEEFNEEAVITASYIHFAVLDKVAGIEIEWVSSLALHLEFDNVRRILKVFRFPSLCKLMFQETNTLSRLYVDHGRYFASGLDLEELGEDRTQEYYREVLLTYRLIFGQNKASWTGFNKKSGKWPEHWAASDKGSGDEDPLLPILCGSSWKTGEAKVHYEEINAAGDSPYYYPDSDFRFFGRRILNLQAFVKGRNPHSVRALWYDRRNITFWWTFWAVLFIGGGTILLGIMQLAFQIWQGESGQRQVPT